MDIQKLVERAKAIRELYSQLENQKYGKEWTREQIVQGFVGDVGDLVKLTMAKEGIRNTSDVDEKIAHELSDCLWSIFIIADKYDIDLESSFEKTMTELESKVKQDLNK